MARDDRAQWEHRYGARTESIRPPSQFLVQHLAALPRGRALDVACGDGRHALHLARNGFVVEAIDIAGAGLRRARAEAQLSALPVHFVQADLEAFVLPMERYRVAVNVRYLQRTLLPALKASLCPAGILVFETFIADQAQLGHPRNPAFLFARDELRHAFADFEILVYDEGRFDTESGPAFLARLLARRPPGWTPR